MNRKTNSTGVLPIAGSLEIVPRYIRSFEIDRDFGDPAAVQGYIYTPAVLFAAQTLSVGLKKGSTQRAWRITGPYGAGKSAFGLFLAHIAARTAPGKKLLAELRTESEDIFGAWQAVPRYLPIAMTGSRMPFGQALVGRLRRAVEAMSTRRPPKLLEELRRQESRALAGMLNDEQVSDALQGFIHYAVSPSQGEYEGVLLLIDEMGKFLEHAALRPEQSDAHVFQRIAEMGAGSSKLPLGIVGFLHQNFADYAAGYGERAQEEWSKVGQRFEDIPFDESLEQYGFLLSKAMRYKPGVLAKSGIDRRAREIYAKILATAKEAVRVNALIESGPSLYPIHPTSFLALATAVKRFGQSQRSLFSFLLAGEAHGLQQYARMTPLHADHWYRLPRLYDYFSSLDGLMFRQGDRARRWDLLRETLAHGPELESIESDVLKTVGLINVFDPVPYVVPDAKAVSLALFDVEDNNDVRKALDRLVEKGILYHRRAQADYCLWRHSSVDLQALYEEASKSTHSITGLDDLLSAIGQGRSLIAHRHYQRTGTLRAFRVRYLALSQLPVDRTDEAVAEYDGEVLVVLLQPDQNMAKALAQVAAHALSLNPARLIVLRKIEPGDLKIATEIRILERIKQTSAELRVDDYARREVDQSLERVRRQLEEQLARVASFGQTNDPVDIEWMYGGKPARINSRRELSVRLSKICDDVYHAAPILHNELINRHRLSTAASLARQRLIGAMLTKASEAGLGFTGMPPERAIYLSLFKETGMHGLVKGAPSFRMPSASADRFQWRPLWETLRAFLSKEGNLTFAQVFDFLGAAPYGLREGPALLVVFAFILSDRRNIVLFDSGTYVVDFTEDHVRRLIKAPAKFAVHLQPRLGGVEGLFQAYADALETIKEPTDILTDAHGVVSCLYRAHARLSDYAVQTLRISQRAKEMRSILNRSMDPVELLTKGLPIACGYPDIAAVGKKKELGHYSDVLRAALSEIFEADAALKQQVHLILNDAFGLKGTTGELRSFLQDNFGPYKEMLGDYKLKAALTRAIDKALPDEAWVESMAALLGERSIAIWKDETVDKFKAEATVFAGQVRRWVALMSQLRDRPDTASLVSVYVTGLSGKEHALLVTDPPQAVASSAELKRELRRIIALNPAEAPLALAEALAEVLSGTIAATEKKKHGNDT